jgi:hypothetical protein
VAEFIRTVPSPAKPLDKQYCAVLRKEEYERDMILICRIPEEGDDSEPMTLVTDWDRAGMFVIGFNRTCWADAFEMGFV